MTTPAAFVMRRVRPGRTLLATIIATGTLMVAPVAAQKWTNVTGNLAYKVSECGNVTILSAVPDSPNIIAGIAARDLWVNSKETTWARLSSITQSQRIANRPSSIVFDPANPLIFWESGIYGGPGIYKTVDGGNTFNRLGDITHNDFVSVDFSDPQRRTLLAGGHEQHQMVYRSLDGGETWKNVGRSLPPGSGHSTHPLVLSAAEYLVNAGGDLPGIYRSTDGGDSWARLTSYAVPDAPLVTASGVLYWAGVERLFRSTDRGATWIALAVPGLAPISPIELPGGRVAAIGATTLIVTADGGASWTPLGDPLPYPPTGVIYSPQRRAFFIWRRDCRELVAPNSVMKLDADLTATPTRP